MSELHKSVESVQESLFDVVIDAGTDPETGLVIAIDVDADGAHVDAREQLTSSQETPVFLGKVSLKAPRAS